MEQSLIEAWLHSMELASKVAGADRDGVYSKRSFAILQVLPLADFALYRRHFNLVS